MILLVELGPLRNMKEIMMKVDSGEMKKRQHSLKIKKIPLQHSKIISVKKIQMMKDVDNLALEKKELLNQVKEIMVKEITVKEIMVKEITVKMVMALVMMMGNTVDKIREHVKVKVTQVKKNDAVENLKKEIMVKEITVKEIMVKEIMVKEIMVVDLLLKVVEKPAAEIM